MAKSTAKITTCSTSFRAAASKKLAGKVCSSTPDRVTWLLANCLPCSAVAVERSTPSPGRTTLTAMRPNASARVVTSSK